MASLVWATTDRAAPITPCASCWFCCFENPRRPANLELAIAGQVISTTNMTKESRPLTQEQRKEFVQLLKDARTRVLENLSTKHFKRSGRAWDVAISNLADRLGAKPVCDEVTAAYKTIKDSEPKLQKLGFRVDRDGDLELTEQGDNKYRGELSDARDAMMEAEVETERKKFETAILNVLATESVEEAKGIVEPLV